MVYGYIYSLIPPQQKISDTWRFFYEGRAETDILFNNPKKFFTDIFYNPYDKGYLRFFSTIQSYWSDLKNNVMIKLVAVFNVFSFKSYYINTIFFSYVCFFGPVALYRIYAAIFPGKTWQTITSCFLVPSFLYWCSGIHKDGLIFTGICFIMYHLHKITAGEGAFHRRYVYIFFCLLFIFPLRNYITVLLIPLIIAWVLSNKVKKKKWAVFTGVYLICIGLFFTSRFIHPKLNLPLSVIIRQTEFQELEGNSRIETTKLLPGFKSFIRNLPEAMNHALLRPYPAEMKGILYIPAAIEVIFYLTLFIFYLFRGRNVFNEPSVLFSFFFSFCLLILIGYMIPFIGAIVRYRSILLPLIITPLLCSINLKKNI